MYAESLASQNLISRARFVYNWSFKNLPLTQHEKVWAKYAPWVLSLENIKTATQVIPRYLKLNPDYKEIYATYLRERREFDLCAKVLNDILLDDGYNSKSGKSKYDFFMDLVSVIIEEPELTKSIDGEALLLDGMKKYPEQVGGLWVKLSDYFIRLGQFERARASLEKAMNTIDSAKDFGLIFNAYCKFEE
jgi:pre-mRNA-splicing factor SYF1